MDNLQAHGVVREKKAFGIKDLLLPGLVFCFFMGLVLGALVVEHGESTTQMVTAFFEQRQDNRFFMTFFYSLSSAGGFLLLLFLCGFGAISQPVVCILLFLRGMGLGTTMGQFYLTTTSGSSAVLISLLLVPAAAVSSYALLLAGRESVKMANRFFLTMTVRAATIPLASLKRYTVKFLILFALLLLSAGIDGVCTVIFMPLLEKLSVIAIR